MRKRKDDRGVNPVRKRDDGRGTNPMRKQENPDLQVYKTERIYGEKGGDGKDTGVRHTFTFHGPRLGADKERPVFKGRRNSWKRRDATTEEGNENND